MLIEFSVQNHRAFREKQTFSMVAGAATAKNEGGHVSETGFAMVPHVLREACFFGANGSGKSSLVHAMGFMKSFVRNSFRREVEEITGVEPFLFHRKWKDEPSEFEVIFLHEDNLYQYGFALTKDRVVEEWLFARPKSTGRQRHLFTRAYSPEKNAYDWDISAVNLKGERDSWKAQTRENALFLSTAVQLNAEALKAPYEWLVEQWRVLGEASLSSPLTTADRVLDPAWKSRILEFLLSADISLADIEVEEKDFIDKVEMDRTPKELSEVIVALEKYNRSISEKAKFPSVSTVRKTDIGESVPLPLLRESSGTQSFFALAAPMLDVLDHGWTLVVDELNSSLHPLAFQHLIRLFCDPSVNKNDAQLIFTTHDTSVTERSCIGRDQIWLVEKGKDLAAKLIPFSDFKTRDARSFQRGYLQGRFGAVPQLVE